MKFFYTVTTGSLLFLFKISDKKIGFLQFQNSLKYNKIEFSCINIKFIDAEA
jgi:hypothetical protein